MLFLVITARGRLLVLVNFLLYKGRSEVTAWVNSRSTVGTMGTNGWQYVKTCYRLPLIFYSFVLVLLHIPKTLHNINTFFRPVGCISLTFIPRPVV